MEWEQKALLRLSEQMRTVCDRMEEMQLEIKRLREENARLRAEKAENAAD
jgi:FtsZ-binding cell division protein ZapB